MANIVNASYIRIKSTDATTDLILYKKKSNSSLFVDRVNESVVKKMPRLIEEMFVPFNVSPCKNPVIYIII